MKSATKTPRNHESQGRLDLCSSDVVGVASCWTGNFRCGGFECGRQVLEIISQMLHVYAIFSYIWLKPMINVGKYSIHGA